MQNEFFKLTKNKKLIMLGFLIATGVIGILTFNFGQCNNACVIAKITGSWVIGLPATIASMILPEPWFICGYILIPIYWYLISCVIVALFNHHK